MNVFKQFFHLMYAFKYYPFYLNSVNPEEFSLVCARLVANVLFVDGMSKQSLMFSNSLSFTFISVWTSSAIFAEQWNTKLTRINTGLDMFSHFHFSVVIFMWIS